MRLAHFIQRYPPALGGSEAYFARLSQFCASQGDAVTVFTTDARALDAFWSPAAERLPAGITHDGAVTVRRYPLWRVRGRRWLLKPLSLLPHRLWQCMTMPCNPITWSMWRDANTEPCAFDAVHASAFPYAWPIVCAWRLARRLGVPFLLTPFLHLGDPDDPDDPTRGAYTAPALRWLLQQADVIFVQTPGERDAMHSLGVAGEIVLQGMGVEPRECTGGLPRYRQDAFVVGHLANLSAEKGTIDLLKALVPLWQSGMPIQLLLAGPQMPGFTRFWTRFARQLPEAARSRVTMLGPVDEVQKRDFFASIDVFALPSRSDSFGLVLLEAWANGVPNVGYRAGGIADVIRHQQDGLLVRCGDVAALTEALARLARDPEQRRRLGEAGHRRLPVEFEWHNKLAQVREVIQTPKTLS